MVEGALDLRHRLYVRLSIFIHEKIRLVLIIPTPCLLQLRSAPTGQQRRRT